jgi:hypothetical protein
MLVGVGKVYYRMQSGDGARTLLLENISSSVYDVLACPCTELHGALWSSCIGSFLPTERRINTGDLKAYSHIPCRSHAVPLPCRYSTALDCVFPI